MAQTPYLLHSLLTQSASRFPDKEALFYKNETITYGALDSESNRLAHYLKALGLQRGQRIGIYMNRSISSVASALGVLKAGATYVPLDPLSPPARFKYIVEKCGIRFLLTAKQKLSLIQERENATIPFQAVIVMDTPVGQHVSNAKTIIRWQEVREGTSDQALAEHNVDSDLAYILFTSGSTGEPKGVMISHLNSLTFINAACGFFDIKDDDRLSNVCPLHFDMSVFDLYVAFKAGASAVIAPENTVIFPSALAEFIQNNAISVWNSVPSTLALLANLDSLDKYDLSSLRLVLFAGEVFPLKYLRRLRRYMSEARFCNIYGQTEANSSTYYWVNQLPEDDSAILPIGKSLPNFDVFAVSEDGKQIENVGEEGELHVRASSVARGYIGNAEKTAECFVEDPVRPDANERVYKTGDLVRLDGEKNFLFVGRKDHMIKSRGYRIEIGEIEAALANHPRIKMAVVIPIPDELIGNRIAAIIVPAQKDGLEKGEVASFCAERLPKYMIPEMMEFRDTLPLTSSGKVDRKRLADERVTSEQGTLSAQ